MTFSRRDSIKLGLGGLAGSGLLAVMPFARAQDMMLEGDHYETDAGRVTIHPVSHASFVMSLGGMTIYADPVGEPSAYDGLPEPDLILVTHEHGDHYNADTLGALAGEKASLITNPAVYGMLPDTLKSKAGAIGNGESAAQTDLGINAIPAYNTTEDRLKYHPQGRDNGYVLELGGTRIYIAGDTEDIPEMRALKNIDIAFVPMNLPFTMDENQAASAVAEFKPSVVYPYHYKGSDIDMFARAVADATADVEVVRGDWY